MMIRLQIEPLMRILSQDFHIAQIELLLEEHGYDGKHAEKVLKKIQNGEYFLINKLKEDRE